MTAAHALKHSEFTIRQKPQDAAGQAGWYLERERLRKNLTLSEAREDTGVPVHLLIALEQGRLDLLPPVDEAISLISAYGNWLGFDPAPLCGHYITLFPRLHEVPRAHVRLARQEQAETVAPPPAPHQRPRLSITDSKLIATKPGGRSPASRGGRALAYPQGGTRRNPAAGRGTTGKFNRRRHST